MWVQQLAKIGLISLNKLGTLENVADLLTKHVPRAVLDKLAGMMGCLIPGEETAKFQAYSSIDQSYWNQRKAALERLPVFDEGERLNRWSMMFTALWTERLISRRPF